MLEIVPSYPRIQFQGKRIIQTQKNDEKPHFGLDLGPFDPFDPISSCTISQKTVDPILRNLVTVGRTDRETDTDRRRRVIS